jgi:hypothetical protein
MVNFRARLVGDTRLLAFGTTAVRVAKEVEPTKKGNRNLAEGLEATAGGALFPAEAETPPTAPKSVGKYVRMLLWAGLSTAFLAGGTLACGLLAGEESSTGAVLLFLAALAGVGGCIFCFYRFLREISRKPRPPYLSTLP